MDRAQMIRAFSDWGEPAYRVDQVLSWVYGRHVVDWEAMTDLPVSLRGRLAAAFRCGALRLATIRGGRDTTRKFLWRLRDERLIETVLIPANPALYGESSDRMTLCISTQVGCAMACGFCASGLDGLQRNLEPAEIVDQVCAVERWAAAEGVEKGAGSPGGKPPRFVSNLVVMGMGEPLANYGHLMRALGILNAPWGGGIGARKITISTSGLTPQIRRLADEPAQYRLAVSLHGATDEVRNRIMPVNRRFPIAELLAACEFYVERKKQMITLEYILIAGVNDGMDQVAPLASFARRLRAKVNLIPYNRVDGLAWKRPAPAIQDRFHAALEARGVVATLRREKGHDIDAACGQLRLRETLSAGDVGAGVGGKAAIGG